MKILLIEDEKSLAHSIINLLRNEGYKVEWVDRKSDAIDKINQVNYDCMLVDITLPDGNGLDSIKQVKDLNLNTGIIIITAKNSVNDRIAGLDLGADDYISKPFHLAELNSRIKALLRRRKFAGNKEIEIDQLKILPDFNQVFIEDKEIELTRKEFELLLFLVSNKNRVITKESIAEHIWGDYIDSSLSYDFIYSHVKNLRKKMTDMGGKDFIQNVYGIGYKFSIDG